MSDTPKADKWREELQAFEGVGRLVKIRVTSVQKLLDDLSESESALAAANKRAEEAVRRLQYMHSAHSDSALWYQNAVAQALKSLDSLPAKLEF